MQVRQVLIVEDNPDTRGWLFDCAQSAWPDAEVSTADDVASSLGLINARSFDVAVVDLGLPDGSGLQVISALRGSSRSADAYIVVATIYDDDKNLFSALKGGARGYILKDQDRDKVISYLSGIAKGETPLSNRVARKLVEHFNARADTRVKVDLAPREEEILRFVAKGFSVADTAGMLGLTKNTVKGYVKSVYAKLGVNSRAEATSEAIRMGLVELD